MTSSNQALPRSDRSLRTDGKPSTTVVGHLFHIQLVFFQRSATQFSTANNMVNPTTISNQPTRLLNCQIIKAPHRYSEHSSGELSTLGDDPPHMGLESIGLARELMLVQFNQLKVFTRLKFSKQNLKKLCFAPAGSHKPDRVSKFSFSDFSAVQTFFLQFFIVQIPIDSNQILT